MTTKLPRGKGLWIQRLDQCQGGDVVRLLAQAQAADFAHIVLKVADGADDYNAGAPEVVQRLTAAGIDVWGGHTLYGDKPRFKGPFQLDYHLQEARRAVKRLTQLKELGLQGYVLETDNGYERLPRRARAAAEFMEALRADAPAGFPVGLAAWKNPAAHKRFPWAQFRRQCDFDMPRVFWIGRRGEAARQLEAAIQQFCDQSPRRPCCPTGPAFFEGEWRPTLEDVIAFFEEAIELGLPAANLWAWDQLETAGAVRGVPHPHAQKLWQAAANFVWVEPVVEPFWISEPEPAISTQAISELELPPAPQPEIELAPTAPVAEMAQAENAPSEIVAPIEPEAAPSPTVETELPAAPQPEVELAPTVPVAQMAQAKSALSEIIVPFEPEAAPAQTVEPVLPPTPLPEVELAPTAPVAEMAQAESTPAEIIVPFEPEAAPAQTVGPELPAAPQPEVELAPTVPVAEMAQAESTPSEIVAAVEPEAVATPMVAPELPPIPLPEVELAPTVPVAEMSQAESALSEIIVPFEPEAAPSPTVETELPAAPQPEVELAPTAPVAEMAQAESALSENIVPFELEAAPAQTVGPELPPTPLPEVELAPAMLVAELAQAENAPSEIVAPFEPEAAPELPPTLLPEIELAPTVPVVEMAQAESTPAEIVVPLEPEAAPASMVVPELPPTLLPEIEFEPIVSVESAIQPTPVEAATPAAAAPAEEPEPTAALIAAALPEAEPISTPAIVDAETIGVNLPAPELEPVVPLQPAAEAAPAEAARSETMAPAETEIPLTLAAWANVEMPLSAIGSEVELPPVSAEEPAPELEPVVPLQLSAEAAPTETAHRETMAPAETEIPLTLAALLDVELFPTPAVQPGLDFKTAGATWPAPELEPVVPVELPPAPETAETLSPQPEAEVTIPARPIAPLEPEPAPAATPETQVEFAPAIIPPAAPEVEAPEAAPEVITPSTPGEPPPEMGLPRLALADLELEAEAEPLPAPLAEPFAVVGRAGSDVVLRFFADLQNENPSQATALYGTEFAHVNADRVERDRAGVRRFYWQMLRRIKARRIVILSLSGQRTAIRARWAAQTLAGAPVQGADTFHLNRQGQILYHHTSFRLE